MKDTVETSDTAGQTPRAWLHRFVRLVWPTRKPKLQRKPVRWRGKCACCGKDITSTEEVYPDGAAVECFGCIIGWTEEGKQRKEDQRQIELYKRAIREIEAEKAND